MLLSFSTRFRSRRLSLLGALGVFGLAALAEGVGTRHFVLEAAKDFEGGELSGVALDSEGRLRAGLDLAPQAVSEAPAVWAALPHQGGLLLATGNEGKLLHVSGGQSRVVVDTDALALTSIVRGANRVFVGATPGGKVYELKGDKLEPFATLEGAENVFALAFDEKESVLYAATGPQGKLFRVSTTGAATVHFDAEQDHLIAVAARGGVVYAGSSGAALLYEIKAPGRATVVHDFEATEVRGIALAADGFVYAIANELRGGGSDASNGTKAAGPNAQDARKGKGVLFRFGPTGLPDSLYQSPDEHLVTLALDDAGRALVGTGAEGRVVRVDSLGRSTILADLDERQVAYVALDHDKGYVVGSDPIVVHAARGLGGREAIYTSKVLDAGLRARFGRVEFDADGKVEVSTRTGNTQEPDASWSDWSADSVTSFETKSPAGRYFQFRVRIPSGSEGALRRIQVPFVTDNLRAIVKQVKADGVATKSSRGLEKSGGPIDGKPSTTVKISFEVENPDEDELRYRVEYRPLSSATWFDALRPGQVLTDDNYSWDTSTLPEGRYKVRVTASDELANPPSRVTTHSQESPIVLVDNTPPLVTALTVTGRKVSGRVRDGVGPIRRIEIQRVGAESWIPIEPKDGIFDRAEEEFEVDLTTAIEPGPQLLTVRVFDTAGNSDVRPLRFDK